MEPFLVAVAAGLLGTFVVGPEVARAARRWIGWRVVLPMFLGWVPERAELGPSSPRFGPTQQSVLPRPDHRAVGVATGLAYALAGLRFGWSWSLPPVLVLLAGLVAVSAVDLYCWRIPTRFVYLTGAGVAAGSGVAVLASTPADSVVGALVGGFVYLLVLGTMHLASPRNLGLGDVRLGVLVGLVVGWLGWTPEHPVAEPLSWVFLALLVASLLGSVAGLVVLAVRRHAGRLGQGMWRESYPFGPWLCLGGFLAILAAGPL